MARNRSKLARYNPATVKALRAEMSKCPNPGYAEMVSKNNMSDADLLDFAVALANSYFAGQLLRIFEDTAKANMELQTRRTLLITAALFGMTAIFDKDGGAVLKSAWSKENPDTQTAAVQALVDVGLTVKQAMASFKTGPEEEAWTTEPIYTRLPEIVKAVH